MNPTSDNLASANLAWPVRDYQAIIFDCDGTLTDSMPVHYVAWHKTMTSYGIHFPEDQFYAMGGMPSDKIVRILASEQSITIDAERAAHEKEAAFVERMHLLEPIEAVIDVARRFRGRIPIAVASGGFRDIILKQLVQIGCQDWFQAIVTAEDTERHKPHPDVFLEAAKRMGVPPQECLVYEDSDLGLEAARAASMDFIDVRTFYSPRRIPIET
jgi:HAD superfamily hydrolase (TIGR01509 family)